MCSSDLHQQSIQSTQSTQSAPRLPRRDSQILQRPPAEPRLSIEPVYLRPYEKDGPTIQPAVSRRPSLNSRSTRLTSYYGGDPWNHATSPQMPLQASGLRLNHQEREEYDGSVTESKSGFDLNDGDDAEYSDPRSLRRPNIPPANRAAVTPASRSRPQTVIISQRRDHHTSMSRPPLVPPAKPQRTYDTPRARVIVESSRPSRRESVQAYYRTFKERRRARQQEYDEPPRQSHRPIDTKQNAAAEDYISARFGERKTLADVSHIVVAKSGSSFSGGHSDAEASDKSNSGSDRKRTSGLCVLRDDLDSLSLYENTEGRSSQRMPAEDNMSTLSISSNTRGEGVYRSERGSTKGEQKVLTSASQARRDAEEVSKRSSRSTRRRRDTQNKHGESRPILQRQGGKERREHQYHTPGESVISQSLPAREFRMMVPQENPVATAPVSDRSERKGARSIESDLETATQHLTIEPGKAVSEAQTLRSNTTSSPPKRPLTGLRAAEQSRLESVGQDIQCTMNETPREDAKSVLESYLQVPKRLPFEQSESEGVFGNVASISVRPDRSNLKRSWDGSQILGVVAVKRFRRWDQDNLNWRKRLLEDLRHKNVDSFLETYEQLDVPVRTKEADLVSPVLKEPVNATIAGSIPHLMERLLEESRPQERELFADVDQLLSKEPQLLLTEAGSQPAIALSETQHQPRLPKASRLERSWQLWLDAVKHALDAAFTDPKDLLLVKSWLFLVVDAFFLTTDAAAIRSGLLEPPLRRNANRLRWRSVSILICYSHNGRIPNANHHSEIQRSCLQRHR